MHRVRTTGRLRRPVAWAAAATLLAVILPAVPATASELVGTATFSGGELVVGKTATFDITCGGIPNSQGATVRLMRSNSIVQTQTPMMTAGGAENDIYTGKATFDLTNQVPGTYYVRVECKLQYNGYQPHPNASGDFQIRAGAVASTTTITASADRVVSGQQVTFTATIPGAVDGSVDFRAGGSSLGVASLTGGRATIAVPVTAETTVTAVYSGGTGYLGSTSASGVTVGVITEIAGPEGFGMGGLPTVGKPSVATVIGDWTPSIAEGTTESYEWKVGPTVVSREKSYTPVGADYGKQLTLTVTASHPQLGSLPMSITLPVGAGDGVQGSLTLGGSDGHDATLGTPLVPQPQGWSPTATLSYVWWVNGQEVSTASTYTPTVADLGKTIRVRATATDPGQATRSADVYVWNVLTDPTVTVGSSTITLGATATVPVTVAGPQGGPVPTGDVAVTLTPAAGGAPVSLGAAVALDGSGKASVRASGLAAGRYTVTAAYLPTSYGISAASTSVASVGGDANPYRKASGTGGVIVTKPVPAITVPGTVQTPVAKPATLSLTVTGDARPSEYVLRSGDTELTRGAVNAIGATTITIPVLAPGTHTLTLVLPETATSAQVTRTIVVTVAGEPDRTGSTPTAKLATPKAATVPGQAMELVADGFQPGETVAFFVHSDPVFLGTAVAGSDGIARLMAVIPADLPVGSHTVVATGGTSGRWAELTIDLAVPGATPTGPSTTVASNQVLATTGSGAGSGLLGAWLLLAVGAGLMIVVRRVRTVRGAA